MIAVIIFLLIAIAIIIGIGVAGNDGVTVVTEYSVGLIGEDGVLRCTFPADLKQSNDILWEKVGMTGTVYKYEKAQISLSGQNAAYKGRTALFINQLVSGNASLKLNKVQLSDAGVYKCTVTTSKGKGEGKLDFKVGAYSSLDVWNSTKDTLHCESPSWYPKPSLTWLNTSSGENLTNLSSTTYEPALNSMQGVVSELSKAEVNSQYTCVIQNQLARAEGDVILT
ncbi:hypothetical protein FKM82_022177, partial [Ascaphus truei]